MPTCYEPAQASPHPADCLKPTLEREHAQAAARRLRRRGKAVIAYRCRACGDWHVGGTNGFKRPMPDLYTNHQPGVSK